MFHEIHDEYDFSLPISILIIAQVNLIVFFSWLAFVQH